MENNTQSNITDEGSQLRIRSCPTWLHDKIREYRKHIKQTENRKINKEQATIELLTKATDFLNFI